MASRVMSSDELLQRALDEDSPTIEPLRINKSPEPRASSAASSRYNFPSPPRQQTFPLPPGASSSAAPLPYPDEESPPFQYPRPSEPRTGRTPFSGEVQDSILDRSLQESPLHSAASSVSGLGSGDQSRPSASGKRASSDTPSRLGSSPVDKRGPRLAERRGTAPISLPDSPDPEEGLFAKEIQRPKQNGRRPPHLPVAEEHGKPSGARARGPSNTELIAPRPMNRFASSASTSTTRATRGSPAPPETPIVGPDLPGGGIEERFAAAGIAGPATLSSLQAQNAAAALRMNQYAPPPVPQLPSSPGYPPVPQQQVPRPWTPTESPETQPHGPPTVYQGPNQVTGPRGSPPQLQQPQQDFASRGSQQSVLEQDFQRVQLSASPPPAYSSVTPEEGGGLTASQVYSDQKRATPSTSTSTTNAPAASTSATKSETPQHSASPPALQHQVHPAFANDPVHPGISSPGMGQSGPVTQFADAFPFQSVGLVSPPPLPEGWISHLDQNSGQYYYIHLATQATQWEFPKGPTPLNVESQLSPTISTYGNPLASPALSVFHGKASPMFPPHSTGYAESILSMTPSALGFSGPPPLSGIEMYKIAPMNAVYFGPYLKYINMDLEGGIWIGSIMLITDASQPPTIHIHKSVDLSPNPRQLKANPIHTHQRWVFYRYDVDLQMSDGLGDKWTYAITSHLGCTRYEFLVAGRYDTNWRFIAHSGNDFGINTNQTERSRLGGVGFMWKDVLQKNVECGGFHVQLGLGDQIYGDRLWKDAPLLRQWLAMSGKDNRRRAQWTAVHEEVVSHAYFHYYTSHFDQPFLREAFAQIPHILTLDDHDIFDGYGSYPDYMQSSHMFQNIGRIGLEMYLLFQHHTTIEILRNVRDDTDIFTVTSKGWHFIKYLGPAVAVVGLDGRSERNERQVVAGPTYQGIFPKVAALPPSIQHCIWMIPVPIVYPRLEAVESFANTIATGKKAVNSTYNLLGKLSSSVAGVVGGKEAVASGFTHVKKAVGKGGLMGNVLNSFGEIDIADELRNMWTHQTKDLERTYLVRTLQGIARQKGIRMTFLSGDVNCCGAGLFHDPSHPGDHKTMYQIISSSIVAAPAPIYVVKLLHNNKILYVPANGRRSTHEPSDTKEDMLEIFQAEVGGQQRELRRLMARRNYVAFMVYDPNEVPGMGNGVAGSVYAGSIHSGQKGLSKLSLAVDYIVQGDEVYGVPSKYGPVVIPNLEFGR